VKKNVLILAALAAYSTPSIMNGLAANPEPWIVPAVQQWQGAEGQLVPRAIWVDERYAEALRPIADDFRQVVQQISGRDLPVETGKWEAGHQRILFTLDPTAPGPTGEGYRVDIGEDVIVGARKSIGVFY
jgi:hypothetical protein